MYPATEILFGFSCVALLYCNNSIQQSAAATRRGNSENIYDIKYKMLNNPFKICDSYFQTLSVMPNNVLNVQVSDTTKA
jgi:hypothetical protein